MKVAHDDKIRQMRERLLARGAELRSRLERVQADLRRETNPLPADSADAAITLENDEILVAIRGSAQSELASIRAALERLESGMYAICETCGIDIDPERLKVVPYASQCAACARNASGPGA
jgi:DnaK suppressor protein